MLFAEIALAGAVSVLAGLDRVAFGQFMLGRPIVVAPVAGMVFGRPMVGLEIGLMLELLWLGRLPVGAAIPPDDTQVAAGATIMALLMERVLGLHGMPLVLLCVLTAIPLGKVGQVFDRLARQANDRLNQRALEAIDSGRGAQVERLHLLGILNFSLASLATLLVIVSSGCAVIYFAAPLLIGAVREAGLGLQYSLVLIGAAAMLGTTNVNRGTTLFAAAFTGTLLVVWLK